ncbi:uncharacterized protein LOC120161086 [Hibiscus syriacus]|uniref:uncharacterized protein LOC120161086 n=1 Tax=Hibiscus syriacus TaxID=106335 RepID=UPI0019235E94|nr:uncharacterized protein LOC120161086 [Hibiscus syriacus]
MRVFEGLHLVWDQGFERVVIQSDNEEAIKLLSPPSSISPYHIVRAIASLDRAWMLDFQLIRREANIVADFMAKLKVHSKGCLAIFMDPPPGLPSLLQRDVDATPLHQMFWLLSLFS